MAFQRLNTGDTHYIADRREDLKTLPSCSMGSTCYIIEDNSKWIVNSEGVWFCQNAGTGNGGVIDPDKPDSEPGISADEIAATYLSKEQYKLEKLKTIKYEVLGLPKNSIVDYREKEIRILIPEDADFKQQQVGAEGDSNMWYFQFKAYAPEEAKFFMEDDLENIEDETMYSFIDNNYAGIDEYGRKYSTGWLAAAINNNGVWTYFGKNSTDSHMIGFFYSVEWYDKDKNLIGIDKIRINLTNKKCHSTIEPYYIAELNNGNAVWANL